MFTHHELMRVQVEIRNNYGNEAIYVVSSHAEAISQLTGKKTINRSDIQALLKLGVYCCQVMPEGDLSTLMHQEAV